MRDLMRDDLQSVLEQDIPDLTGKTIVIWGTGNTAQLYFEGICRLKAEGFEVAAYCDSNPSKWGQSFNGKPVIKPEELKDISGVCVLICTPHEKAIYEIRKVCREMGVECYLIAEAILKNHSREVLKCYDLLEDNLSKKIYAKIAAKNIGGGYFTDIGREKDQYFALPEFSVMDENEVFVDCGAFVGDTVEQYIWNREGVFRKIIAFEPDAGNYKALSARVERLKKEWNIADDRLLLYPYGISEKNSEGTFASYGNNYGLGSKFTETSDGEGGCRLVALDDFVTERYSFLKADIESYEYKMLLGARKGIGENKPLIAVCIYHNAVDLYSIPLLVKSMVGEYKMAVRHHTYTLADTVLYCWCD